jgi:rare lipoprotein A (peptidoglycan hydrolase)
VRVRKAPWVALCAALVTVAAAIPPGASAQSIQDQLEDARAAQDSAMTAQQAAERTLREYERVRAELELAVRDVMIASRARRELSEEIDGAQQLLDRRASMAYQLGPALTIELFLGSRTPGDFASVQEYLAHTIQVDEATLADVTGARHDLQEVSDRMERTREGLAEQELRLRLLAADAAARIEAAKSDAEAASRDISRLEKELADAQAAAAAALATLVDATKGFDQSELLALLGPSEGKGCKIPDGLEDTGQRVDGLSSWYGWEFAGQTTASGAIFDPTLFTVANKELPLNVFLRIHYKGKCAIALLNDRGPYGGGRVFDVSEAVADYLGYLGAGVAWVEADVLVPR